jgi:hypothetical protein
MHLSFISNQYGYYYRAVTQRGKKLVSAGRQGFDMGMKIAIFTVLIVLVSLPTLAAEQKLEGASTQDILSDITLASSESGRVVEQIFQKSVVTLYVVDGQQSQGFWRVEADKYCSQWPPSEHWDCYDVFGEDGDVTFVSSSGTRTRMELPSAD